MAEDIVRRGCGAGVEWWRENGNKAERRCGSAEGE